MTVLQHEGEQLRTLQLGALRSLIASLIPDNRFYTKRLRDANIGPGIESLDAFIQRMPFTTKAEIMADQLAHPPFGTNLTYPIEFYTRFCQTSATTGSPMRWLDTEDSWQWMASNWCTVFKHAGITKHDIVYFAFSFGPFLGFWTAFDAARATGCLCIPGGGTDSIGRLRAILGNEVTVLCCTPTYAIRLAEVAAEERIDLSDSRVRRIVVAGEAGGSIPSTRAKIESLWPGAAVYDHHGMTEVGPVSFECNLNPGKLHIMNDRYLAEIINPVTGDPAEPYETGELVLTTLGRTGSPLLRYRTGDLVLAAAEPTCACGSQGVALQGGILARADDMVVVRGVNIFPSAVEEVIRKVEGIADYRVTVSCLREMSELEVEIEPAIADLDGEALADRLQKELRGAFSLRIPVRTVNPGELPRFEMKARRWVKVQ